MVSVISAGVSGHSGDCSAHTSFLLPTVLSPATEPRLSSALGDRTCALGIWGPAKGDKREWAGEG